MKTAIKLNDVQKLRIQDLTQAILNDIEADSSDEDINKYLRNYLEGFVMGFKFAAALNLPVSNEA